MCEFCRSRIPRAWVRVLGCGGRGGRP